MVLIILFLYGPTISIHLTDMALNVFTFRYLFQHWEFVPADEKIERTALAVVAAILY